MAGATSSSVCAPCPGGSYSNATGLLRAVKDAVSKLDVVLILLPTVTQPMTSYTKRSLHAVAVTCIAHLTQRGQSRRETTFLVRYSKKTNCPAASHLVKSSISNGWIRRDHTLSHRLETQYISSKNLICNPRVSPDVEGAVRGGR